MTKDKRNNNIPYFCNRPQLAGILISKGFKPDFQANPWNPSRVTWAFPATIPLLQMVTAYYRDQLGTEPPSFVREKLQELQGKNEVQG